MAFDFKSYLDFSVGTKRYLYSEILTGLAIGLFSLVLNLHLLEIGLNENEIGKVFSTSTLIICFVSLPLLMFTNHFDRKKLFVFGFALMTLGYLIFGFGTKIEHFYIGQCVLSIGGAIMFTYEMPLLYDYCRTPQEEIKAFNLLYAVFTVSVGVGTLIGGLLPKFLKGFTTSYQGTVLLAGGLLLLLTIIRWLWLPKVTKTQNLSQTKQPSSASKKERIYLFLNLGFFILLINFSSGWIGSFLNVIFKVKLEWKDEWVSTIIAFSGVFLFVGSILVPILLTKVSTTKSYLLIFFLNILSNLVLYFALPEFLFVSILLFRSGFTLMLCNMADSQTLSAVSDGDRNFFAAFRTLTRNIGIAGSTFFTGYYLAKKDYATPFFWAVITLLVCLMYFFVLVRPKLRSHNEKQV